MKTGTKITFSALSFAAVAVPVAITQRPQTIRPNCFVGIVEVGGLTPEAARFKLRAWWEADRLRPLTMKSDAVKFEVPLTPSRFGIGLDDVASLADLPMADPMTEASAAVGQNPEPIRVAPKFRIVAGVDSSLVAAVAAQSPERQPAKVRFEKGGIFLSKERAPIALDAQELQARALASLPDRTQFELPISEKEKRVPDEALARIKAVIGSYTTRFSAGNRPRSSNIALAASVFNGQILMPGERISYNDTVGRRTTARGFKPAGVYINGRHDTGIGGGICQVSTTLYNAALFANLGIVRRQNHSLPVPYVPLGRDATVDFGNIDLVLENTTEAPIAVFSEYKPGTLTFRILGEPIPGQKVVVTQGRVSSTGRGVRTVVDRNLKPGSKRVIESGSAARSVFSWRTVYLNGQVVKREDLGRSFYGGGPRIIAVGPSAPASSPN